MTSLRWTEPANADFLGIVEWLLPRNPQAAEQVGRTILAAIDRLPAYPLLGKPGRSGGTRELPIGRFPYLVVYEAAPGATAEEAWQITILRILHGRCCGRSTKTMSDSDDGRGTRTWHPSRRCVVLPP